MQHNEILNKFTEAEALLEGHFILSSGLHSAKYIQCARVMMYPEIAHMLCQALVKKIKEKIESLENYQSKSTVVNSKITNVDVFTIISDESYGYVNFFQVAFGSIIQSHTVEIKKKLEESDAEMLPLAIVDLRQRFNSQSKEIYVPFEIDLGPKIKICVRIFFGGRGTFTSIELTQP